MTDTDLSAYQLQLAHELVKQVFAVVQLEKEKHGETFSIEIVMMVLSSIIATAVNRSVLMTQMEPSAYNTIKYALELCIANGFESGLIASGKPEEDCDVFCKIYSMDKPANKLPA